MHRRHVVLCIPAVQSRRRPVPSFVAPTAPRPIWGTTSLGDSGSGSDSGSDSGSSSDSGATAGTGGSASTGA
ncbi:MAG: hypothetical protein IPN32_38425 [Deltaproteobacteria bacterium]|nr:hypothetical protein [Deltaproteobacteria bacterium]